MADTKILIVRGLITSKVLGKLPELQMWTKVSREVLSWK
jgi:hypothetical protein